jgi:hypothetical protein
MPTNLLAHHLNVLHDAGIVVRSRSERGPTAHLPAGCSRTPASRPRRQLGTVSGLGTVSRVVFVRPHNSARSKLAAALGPSQSHSRRLGRDRTGAGASRAIRIGRRHRLAVAAGIQTLETVRPIRDEIERRVRRLFADLQVPTSAT